MDDKDFPARAASFLSSLSETQRARLSEMAANYGKTAPPDAGAQDAALRGRSPRSPTAAERAAEYKERFPHANRLKKGF